MKTVLITGASRGIGRAIAKRLAYDGYRIIINYNKSEKEARELEREIRCKGSLQYNSCSTSLYVRKAFWENFKYVIYLGNCWRLNGESLFCNKGSN